MKELYRLRIVTMMIMIIIWSFGTTFISHLYGEIDPKILGFLLAGAMVPSMFQHRIIKIKTSILLGYVLLMDTFLGVSNLYFVTIDRMDILPVIDIIVGSIYSLLLSVVNNKITNGFLHKAKLSYQNSIRAKIDSGKVRNKFIGLMIGSGMAIIGLTAKEALMLQAIIIIVIAVPISVYLWHQSVKAGE